ncbi:helicase-associated domain-containing protein [Lentzea tibetensis]|nr:helicase-associated domain-containing protein [Lentzea tibetensis]
MGRRKTTLATWLLRLEPDEVTAILLRRRDVADRYLRSMKDLAEELTSPDSVRASVAALDQGALDVLGAVVGLGEHATPDAVCRMLDCPPDEVDRALGELRSRALVWPDDHTLRMVNSLKPEGAVRGRITPRPPAPRLQEHRDGDRTGVAAALSTVDGVTRLLEHCDAEEFAARRYSGGAGTRDVRRAASLMRTSESRLRLWLELAVEAQLIGIAKRQDRLLPTRTGDEWRAQHPGRRLAALIPAWRRMNWQPATDKARSALLDHPGDQGAAIRRSIVERFAEVPEGQAVADTRELVAELTWLRPALHDPVATAAAVAEAESLGLVARGGLTSLGRALPEDLGDVAESLLPDATAAARFQTDLTVVVRGLPTAELSSLLDLVADTDERDVASVWRLSTASVRRALDIGMTADDVLAELGSFGELPEQVTRLVNDVAQRHGQLTVTGVGCCVRGDDPLLTELTRQRCLQSLGLRFLAPTVLASVKPVPETLAALRAAGYAPTNVDASGTSIVERVEPERASGRGQRDTGYRSWRQELSDVEITQLAVRLVEQERPVPPPRESPRLSNARLLRDQSLFLPDAEVLLLAEALVTSSPVEIRYADGPRRTDQHVITPVTHAAGNLTAHCAPTGDARDFLVSHIRKVSIPEQRS